MLLELWRELKQGVVGGLIPVGWREVGQRLPESRTSGFMKWTPQWEPKESLSPYPQMNFFESNLYVFSSQLSQM